LLHPQSGRLSIIKQDWLGPVSRIVKGGWPLPKLLWEKFDWQVC
jgi:hypothetical protein